MNQSIYRFFCLIFFCSCRSFVEVPAPSTSTNTDIVFSNDAVAASVMTGVYVSMTSGTLNSAANSSNVLALSVYPELSADNLMLFDINNASYQPFYRNNLRGVINSASRNNHFWLQFYPLIYKVNAVIEGVNASKGLTQSVSDQLRGEALFVRAFLNFYLVNLYGDIPLPLTTDYSKNSVMKRSAAADVYNQIIADLVKAESMLRDEYVDATLLKNTIDRLRPVKFAANALLARAYLYMGDYLNAEIQATKVIDKSTFYGIVPLNQVFLKNSRETIWALQPIRAGENTQEALFYTLPSSGPSNSGKPVYLSDSLMKAFESQDQRKATWTGTINVSGKNYPFVSKYKMVLLNAPVNEFSIVLRLSEQYLIRAEARAQQNELGDAKADLDVIRNRSGLGGTPSAGKDQLLSAIINERKVELFTEWGHRWFDLKRTKRVNDVMKVATVNKGGTWDSTAQFYPVPSVELVNNPALIQNLGYK